MKKKEKIFEKLNIKDYSNHLEKILEKKQFSLDTRNLFFSMLYKIENGYVDYEKTKVEVPTKNEFIENIFQSIQECNDIVVAEFNSKASNILKEKNVTYILEKDEKKIIALGNELLVLNCILEISERTICMPQEKQILQEPISYLLNLGNRINQVEVIRDFNGWSWDTILKEIPDININIIFQTVLYLVRDKFIKQWMKNDSELADYLELMQSYIKENFGEKRAKQFMTLFCKLSIDIAISKKEGQYQLWKKKRDCLEMELEKLQNKAKFLEEKTKEKKEYTKQIERIDKILSNKELLKKEYTKRNEKLPNKEKIFSISHLVDRLGKERQELLEKIKNSNELIEPKGYVARKQEVEEKVNFLRKLDIEQKEDRREIVIELCKLYLECFQIKIAKAKTKKEVLDYIYELRYYGFLPFDAEGTTLKEILTLQFDFEKIRKTLLEKARKLDVIDEVTDDERANEEILNNIFDSKMIDLNHMVIETRVTDGKLYVEYYDEKVLETTVQIQSDRTIRLKKKTKLFI